VPSNSASASATAAIRVFEEMCSEGDGNACIHLRKATDRMMMTMQNDEDAAAQQKGSCDNNE
jgi:hypothetical protein